MGLATTIALRAAVALRMAVLAARDRLGDDSGELSSQQVIWIATLATIAIAVGAIITTKVTAAANGLNLGGSG